MASLLNTSRLIPGLAYVTGAPDHPTAAPGITPNRMDAYRPVSFAAQREYRDDDDGWQTTTSRRWKGQRKGNGKGKGKGSN